MVSRLSSAELGVRRACFWSVGCALALAACDGAPPPAPEQAASSVSEAPGAHAADRPTQTKTLPASEARPPVARIEPDCRATSVTGVARFGSGDVLERGEKLIGKGWLELAADARVLVKHTQTAREWVLVGPALAAFCPQGREEVVLGNGTLQTEMGAGVRPGGEVTVGTPFGTVSYGDARLKLQVSAAALVLTPEAGEAWLTPAGVKPVKDVRISGKTQQRRTSQLEASQALATCAEAARRSEELARVLPTPAGGSGGLGQRAAEHMRARKQARNTCANAAAAVVAQLRGQEREDRLRELGGHERAWQRVVSAADEPK